MIFLKNFSFIKNPYLKSKFVEVLFFFTMPLYQTRDGEPLGQLDAVFYTHPLAKEFLVHNILKIYIGKLL
jgi:ubiquitin conjugation factor E4 B